MKQTIFLVGPIQRQYAKQCIDKAPDDYVCELKQKTRTLEQNAKFHAMCTDISRQLEYLGKKRTPNQWKVIFVSGHAIATGRGAEVIPGLEGEFVNIRESTADMGTARKASLIEYVYAYGSENNVVWSEDEEMMRRYG